MRRRTRLIVVTSVLFLLFAIFIMSRATTTRSPKTFMETLKLTSAVFADGGFIPKLYTCDGKNINPPLSVSGVPADAKSLTLILDDPDAPAGVWDHWVIFNLDPKLREIQEGVEPPGTAGRGTAGNLAYAGPCPPRGAHRYIFKLYALDIALTLPEGSSTSDLEKAMTGHIVASDTLTGLYERH